MLYTCICYGTVVSINLISPKIMEVLSPCNGELEIGFVPSIWVLTYISISYFP